MVQQTHPSDPLISDLFRDAMATAYPDRFGSVADDPQSYRMPLNRLSEYLDELDTDAPGLGLIDWTPALQAAYQDGYDPLAPIGEGSSSSVWRCIDRSFGREVALKSIRDESNMETERAVQTLQEEAELLGRLQHPGIVQAVRRSGTGRGSYLAIDFVDGDNLLTHARLLQLDGKTRIRLFARTLDAVAYLHAKGIIHGDLKPDHILIREHNQPVLIDFGLSSLSSSRDLGLLSTRQIGGSGHYRAPEVVSASASEPTPSQDVYSLGVLLRELIADVDLGDASACIEQAVHAATQEDPEQRPQDAKALLERLQPALTTQPFVTRTSPAATVRTWILAAAVILLLGFLSVTWLIPAADDPQPHAARSGDDGNRLAARASLFDLALQDIYTGNTQRAIDRLSDLSIDSGDTQASWESRHIKAMAQGQGETYPFGENPYESANALRVDYAAASNTLAYIKYSEGRYELWVRSLNESPRLIYATSDYVYDIAIGEGGTRLALVKKSGECLLWTLDAKNLEPIEQSSISLTTNPRIAWFAADKETLLLFSPLERTLVCWSLSEKEPTEPTYLIQDCDNAYRLASGQGSFMVATKGEHTETGKTQLRVFNRKGKMTRRVDLEDGQLPISADTAPGPDASIALGMPKGYVRILPAGKPQWLAPSDLSTNSSVTAVLVNETESRVFASLGRIHVIDMDGTVLMRLGNRDSREHLITQFDYDASRSALTSVSVQDLWRCVGQ